MTRTSRRRSSATPASPPYIAVVGGGKAPEQDLSAAEEIGSLLAKAGAYLVTGGLGGVMERACRGAKAVGGTTIGILPSEDRDDGNPFLDIVIPTGLGEARNALVVNSCDALIAVGGEFGTLSEIGLALRAGKPVVGLATWQLGRPGMASSPIIPAVGAADAVERALTLASN